MNKEENKDIHVDYSTETKELRTGTDFDLPDVKLDIQEIYEVNKSVSGTYKDLNSSVAVVNKKEDNSRLYDKLITEKNLIDYIEIPISKSIKNDIKMQMHSLNPKYELLVDNLSTYKELIQYLVDLRWIRFNILDNYMRFSEYAQIVTKIISGIKVTSEFPVLIDRNTILKKQNKLYSNKPYSIDSKNNSIVYTDELGNARMDSTLGKTESHSVNIINLSCNWINSDWLITNKYDSIEFKSVNNSIKSFNVGYSIMSITAVRYEKEYMILYLISGYSEHALIFDKDFNLVEDTVTETFPSEIVNLLDPKTIIFRDKFQYYVNNNDGRIFTFPLTNMLNIHNIYIPKFKIVETTLINPRPVSVMINSPRINTLYDKIYYSMWSYNDSISLMTLLPAVGYTFNKYSFYNPRKYLTVSDYDEACIPLHKGFVRTQIYPWFWGRPGYTWVGDWYGDYYGRYFSYWNMFYWFYW